MAVTPLANGSTLEVHFVKYVCLLIILQYIYVYISIPVYYYASPHIEEL